MRRPWRAPFLAAALLSMAWGVWLGLLRLGWALPLPRPDQLVLHGPLMIGGFLGTLIGLERAVGVARPWAYAAPLFTASGSLLLVAGPPGPAGALLITAGSAVVVIVLALVSLQQPSLFALTMTTGAVAWFVGNAHWTAGAAVYRIVFWWAAFLVLTIAGERLELNRLLRPSAGVRAVFVAAAASIVAGAALLASWPAAGVHVAGAGFTVLGVWLGRHDIARRTVRQPGLTRFIALCLLSGYVWLGVAGVIAWTGDAATPGPLYDGMLHAIFLGFVVSMIFGQAPVIFPAILGRPLPFRSSFYVHLAVLHVSVALRLIGDTHDVLGRWRVWGGLLNGIALLIFIANSAWSMTARVRGGRRDGAAPSA
jgi:hypothetical protein